MCQIDSILSQDNKEEFVFCKQHGIFTNIKGEPPAIYLACNYQYYFPV